MKEPQIPASCIQEIYNSPYIHLYDLQYERGRHYLNASRRKKQDLAASKSLQELKNMTPDAVSIFTIVLQEGQEPAMLLTREFRYPAGQYLLSVPAGLIDPADGQAEGESAPLAAARREIREEAGVILGEKDSVNLINPLVFSSPGMTDESNALVCILYHPQEGAQFSSEGTVGAERIDDYFLVNEEQARQIITAGTDSEGIYYPVYTWMALMYFLSGMWKDFLRK